jgi:hypothetical protein
MAELEEIAARVDDIEKTIGDIAQVLYSLKDALSLIPEPPNCPPYCGHGVDDNTEDPLSLEDRVKDIKKCIGDVDIVFGSLIQALDNMAPPNCPPYCAHEVNRQKSS